MARQQLPPQIRKRVVKDRYGKDVTRYEVILDVGVDPSSGKRRQVRRRHKTEMDAREALTSLLNAARTGTFVPRKDVTVKELCDEWFASLHNARPTTVNAYRFSVSPLVERMGVVKIQRVRRADLDKLLRDLREGGTTTQKGNARRPWSSRSLNKAIETWRAVFDYAVERQDIPKSPAHGMKKVERVRKEMQTYTADEIAVLLRHADTERNGVLCYLALSGLRRGEIAGLRWSDIDFAKGVVRVVNNRVQVGAHVAENAPKTASSRRTLPLDDGLMAVLRRASARHAAEKLQHGLVHTDQGYVLCDEIGRPYTPDTLTRIWLKIGKRAGVRRLRLHDARHSCATALHLRGVPLAVIAAWLGHRDASITARLYAHSQDDALQAASAVLASVVTVS
jgi:integrase